MNANPTNDQVELASKDLEPRERERVSVYMADNEVNALRLVVLFAMTFRDRPGKIDALYLPACCLDDLDPSRRDLLRGAPELRIRHYELRCLEREGIRKRVSAAVLNHPAGKVMRLSERDLIDMAKVSLRADPALRSHLSAEWVAALT